MNYKKNLAERLTRALGKECADVVDELFTMGVLDDVLARRGCIVYEYLVHATDTTRSDTAILSEIAEQFGVSEKTAYNYLYRTR